MKLFIRYSRVNIIASILALLLGSIGYYFMVRYILIRELDDTLKIEEAEILDNVRTRDRLPEPANYRDQQIQYVPAPGPVARKFIHSMRANLPAAGEIQDVPVHAEGHRHLHHENEPYRQLLFSVQVGGEYYTVSVSKSEEEMENLLWMIMLITAGMILLLLGILFLANRLLLRRIWQPFYRTLDGIRRFNLSTRQALPAGISDIEEFDDLDEAVGQMTSKIMKDYEMLRNFADNASHEMQTPLAILNSKLDLMIQDPLFEERHHLPIQAMYDAIGRLRQLNQSLLLLTRIENNQFAHTESIDFSAVIGAKLIQLEDLTRDRHLQVTAELNECHLPVNAYLADILLNNLLLNAIRHNEEGGRIDIRLRPESLRISNTGPALPIDPATIFDRFTKSPHSGGTGLGLAIVRQIAESYRFELCYSYSGTLHIIDVRFIPLQNFTKIAG